MPNAGANYYSISAAEALKKLGSGTEGLNAKEAAERLKQYGNNVLKERKKRTVLDMFIGEFKDFVILLLIAAAIISAATTFLTNEGEYIDSVAILAIVFINAVIGVYQEYNAGKAIEALRKLIQPKAKVLRDGKEREIATSDLVPGDIILLSEGDKVPADARLIEAHNLEVSEASLTGESAPAQKDALSIVEYKMVINDRNNMVFMSTLVTAGSARAVVCFTGESTEIGRIANLVQEIEDEQTPLQVKLESLGKQLGKLAIAATILVFIVGIGRSVAGAGVTIKIIVDMFLIAVSLAVAAIPEGLPAVVTIALAIGVQRMAKRNSIIRRLPAAEGLGSSTIICSDKTGTLTKNEMTVRKVFTNRRDFGISGQGYEAIGEFLDSTGKRIPSPLQEPNLTELLNSAILCNNAALAESSSIIGDPTEACLLVAAKKAGIDYSLERRSRRKLEELPFDSSRKMMTVIYEEEEAGKIAYTKGAPEMLVEKCGYTMRNGKIEKLTSDGKAVILKKNASFASEGLRVLGFAFKMIRDKSIKGFKIGEIENELVFVGLMAMMDSPRQEAREAIAICKKAGIKAVMITGDNDLTARAVAKELGMYDERKDLILTGRKLEELTDAEFEKIVGNVAVYARVSPEHKLRIVAALQKKGEIVAMTGDGVNDAPAIKKSDIGVAMGITGTDVAKESADMVITDDNFASIVAAVEEGRIVFDNIMKAVKYLLSCNIGEVLVILVAILLGWDSPLIPIQILWMNLATDALPALALAADTKALDIMARRPRNPGEPLISDAEVKRLAFIGILMAIGTLGLFWYVNLNDGLEKARTVAFSTIIFFQLFLAMSWHTGRELLVSVGVLKNRFLFAAVILGLVAQVAIVQTGVLEAVFKTVPLSAADWLAILMVGSSIFILGEVAKHYTHFRKTGRLA